MTLVRHTSVIGALESGVPGFVSTLAEATGRSKSHVGKVLRQHEALGTAWRSRGDGTAACPDHWHAGSSNELAAGARAEGKQA